ncbi:hypothetical protein ACFLYO_03360 [Chloroflexota bacterium]
MLKPANRQMFSHFRRLFPAQTPAAITNGPGGSVWVAAAPNDSPVMNLVVPELDSHLAFRLSVPGQPSNRWDVIGLLLPPWAMYISAVGWAWTAQGHSVPGLHTVPGLDAVIHTQGGIQEGFVWETGLAFAAVWQDIGAYPQPAGGLLGLMTQVRGYFRG